MQHVVSKLQDVNANPFNCLLISVEWGHEIHMPDVKSLERVSFRSRVPFIELLSTFCFRKGSQFG
jgi:hypothetical protein